MTFPEKTDSSEKKHSAVLKNREKLTLDGVSEVLSFDETAVVLHTALGSLCVEGEDLHVTKLLLDCGEVAIEGNILALVYEDRSSGRGGLFRRAKKP